MFEPYINNNQQFKCSDIMDIIKKSIKKSIRLVSILVLMDESFRPQVNYRGYVNS